MLGLVNNGNTCYLNSALQLITSSKYFINYVIKNQFDNESLYIRLLELTVKKWTDDKVIINPSIIHKMVSQKSGMFRGRRQEDSHTFLLILFELLRDENKDIIEKSFDTRIKYTNTCQECNKKTIKRQTTPILSINCSNNFRQSFDEFFSEESEIDYNCEDCNSEKINIKTSIEKYGSNLILHIRRYERNPKTQKYTKNNDDFIIKDKISFSKRIYELRGFIAHFGSGLNSGHYVFIGKDVDKNWCIYNDKACNVIPNFELKTFYKSAYILLYDLINIKK